MLPPDSGVDTAPTFPGLTGVKAQLCYESASKKILLLAPLMLCFCSFCYSLWFVRRYKTTPSVASVCPIPEQHKGWDLPRPGVGSSWSWHGWAASEHGSLPAGFAGLWMLGGPGASTSSWVISCAQEQCQHPALRNCLAPATEAAKQGRICQAL